MNKPQAKSNVLITKASPATRIIRFEADSEIALIIRERRYGSFIDDEAAGEYVLKVSRRYEFEDVKREIESMAA